MILVDAIAEHVTSLRHKQWSHMISTVNREELHEMADRLDLRRSWFQHKSFNHYDITPPKRTLAIKFGAVEVSSKELLFANHDYSIRRSHQSADWFPYVRTIAERASNPQVREAILATVARVQVKP
jgi:hypothetical protein